MKPVIGALLCGAIAVGGIVVLPSFWRGDGARAMYRNFHAASEKAPSPLVVRTIQTFHLSILLMGLGTAYLSGVAVNGDAFVNSPFGVAVAWGAFVVMGADVVTTITGRPRSLLPPWARTGHAREFLSGDDGEGVESQGWIHLPSLGVQGPFFVSARVRQDDRVRRT